MQVTVAMDGCDPCEVRAAVIWTLLELVVRVRRTNPTQLQSTPLNFQRSDPFSRNGHPIAFGLQC